MYRSSLRNGVITALAVVHLALAAIPALADRPLSLSLVEGALVVDDVEPGSTVVLTTIERASRGYIMRNTRRDYWLVDEDADGTVSIATEGEVPAKFIAVAMEIESGRFDVWLPEGSHAREIALPLHALQNGSGERLSRLEDDRRYVELLLVRPGVGAWWLGTGDGTVQDESPSSDGITLTALSSLKVLGDSGPAPEEFLRNDLLFRVAPQEMEYYVARIVLGSE